MKQHSKSFAARPSGTQIRGALIRLTILFWGFNLVCPGAPLPYGGVNLSGAEFGEHNLPGAYGTDYIYPTADELDYFKSKNMNIIRLPFRWERLQPSLYIEFNQEERNRLDAVVQAALERNLTVILDPHNYARYHNELIGTANVPNAAFVDFWSRLAQTYKSEPKVWFGLMNEPHDMQTENWLTSANAAIAGIRSAGAINRILVPGNGWTGAHSWYQTWYGASNADVLRGILDPADNYAIEVHQYLDDNSSGTLETVVSATIGSERLQAFTGWCRDNGIKAFLGEFAVPRIELGYQAVDDLLNYMENNADVWEGWTWWSAGPWWNNYMFSLEPSEGDRPQMATLVAHLPIAVPEVDADHDELNDAWEIHYFGSTDAAADEDWDHDGLSNISEYIYGSDPTNAVRQLSFALSTSNHFYSVKYMAAATLDAYYPNKTRYFDLYTTDNLTNEWTLVTGHARIQGDDTQHSYSEPVNESSKFFKLQSLLE